MNKKHNNLLKCFITLFFLIEFFLDSNTLINTIFKTINLCLYNLFPSIFIFFTITDILNNYNFPFYVSKLLGNIFSKLFHIPKESSYILIMSFTSGFPGNSKLIKDSLDNKIINSYDATKILTMTHFSNPLFIIYTVGINFFKDIKIGLIILISHFITNFIVGFLFRNIYYSNDFKNNSKQTIQVDLITLLKKSFYNTTKLLINILGIIIFFAIITTTLTKYLNLNSFSNTIITGLIEITTGLKYLSILNISKIKAAILATFFISFGGFSIHMQTMSILNKYDVNYYVYLIARIIHGAISSLITFIILINYY